MFPHIDITIDIQAELPFTVEEETTVPGAGTFQQVKVTEGDMITLTCRTTATASESVVWTHDNNPISFNGFKIAVNDNVSLQVW